MPANQLASLVPLIRGLLGEALLGIYLHGSSTLGGLRPTSDLDLFVVTSRRTTRDERRRLIALLLGASGRGDPSGRSRSVDVTLVARPDIHPWAYPGRLDLQYGDWLRGDFARGNESPWDEGDPNLAIALAMVLQADHPLVGPPPAELIGPVPWNDVRRAMCAAVPGLLDDLEGDERNVVLTLARIWATLETERFVSKDAAADWAGARLPIELRPVVARARRLYLDGIRADDFGELSAGIGPLVERLVEEIERAGEVHS